MAITAELIKQQQVDTPFTDSQIALIEKLSRNDEDQVIHSKRGDWYKQFDQTILEESGIQKEGAEKASDYAKRVLAAQKAQIAELSTYKTKVGTLESKIATLEAGKVDEASVQKLKDLNSELANLKKTHAEQLEAKETLLKEKENALLVERAEAEFAFAITGVQFKKDDTTTALKDMAIKNAKAAVLAEATMGIMDGKRVWRDKQGEIIRNPKNGNEPITTAELLLPKLAPIIDQGRKVEGTGTKGAAGSSSPSNFAPNAKTRTDFDRQAGEYLMAQGLDRTNPAFASKLTELRKEFNVSELPVT